MGGGRCFQCPLREEEARSRRSILALSASLILNSLGLRAERERHALCPTLLFLGCFQKPSSPHCTKHHCHAYESQEQRVARFLPRPCGLKAGTKAVQFQASPAEATLLTRSGDRGGAREQVGGRPILRILLQVLAHREGALRCARAAHRGPLAACPLPWLGHLPGLPVEGFEALTLRCFRFSRGLCFPSQGGGG